MEWKNSKWNVTCFANRLTWKSISSIPPILERGIAGGAGIAGMISR